MNDHHGDAVGAVMGIMERMLVVAVVKILHCACAVSNITKLGLGRVSPFMTFLK